MAPVGSCSLVEITDLPSSTSPEVRALFEQRRRDLDMTMYRHTESASETETRALLAGGRRTTPRTLTVILNIDTFSLDDAWRHYLNIRRWRHVSVGVYGSLQERLEDQRRIGRVRRGGERSPVSLPDWYDLTHIAYGHPELGFDPNRAVWQYLPPEDEPYLNIAEALHLRQPA